MVSVLGFVGRSFGYVLDSLWPAPAVQHANHLADFEAMVEVLEPRCGTCHQELDADGECAWERLVEAAATTPAVESAAVETLPTSPAADLTSLRDKVQALYDETQQKRNESQTINERRFYTGGTFYLSSVLGMLDNLIDGPGEPGGPW